MKEAGLRGRACVLPGILAGLGMVGMGLVSDNVARADTTTVTDSINVTVLPSCTFNGAEDKNYIGSATNGTEVNNFSEGGIHEFNIFCNNNNGFIVTASAEDLSADGVAEKISYTDNYTHTGPTSMWTAQIASETEGVTVLNEFAPAGGGTIISSETNTKAGGATFTATYKAYVGSATPAGTYNGTITYTLTASGTSNTNAQHPGNTGGSSDSNTEPGGETETPGGEDTGNPETPDQQTDGDANQDQQTGGSGASTSNTNSLTPANNTTSLNTTNTTNHTTYNTYNTYSTTNYGGATTPVSMPTTVATTTGDSTDSSTTDDTATTPVADNANTATTNYQKPLGVTSSTSTKSTSSDSMDPMPIVATGAITAAVIAGAALASSGRKEEK